MVYTDHQAQTSIFDSELEDRLARWQLGFSAFDYVYTHVPVKCLAIAVGFSRVHGSSAYSQHEDDEEALLAYVMEGAEGFSLDSIGGDLKTFREDPFYDDILRFKELPRIELYPEYGKMMANKFKQMRLPDEGVAIPSSL